MIGCLELSRENLPTTVIEPPSFYRRVVQSLMLSNRTLLRPRAALPRPVRALVTSSSLSVGLRVAGLRTPAGLRDKLRVRSSNNTSVGGRPFNVETPPKLYIGRRSHNITQYSGPVHTAPGAWKAGRRHTHSNTVARRPADTRRAE